MIQYRRPRKPSGFAAAARPPTARGRLDDKVWSQHKAAFSAAQHGKCGYCESYIAASDDGDVEHFAPKAAVHDFDPGALGTEKEPSLPRLRSGSRKTIPRSTTGYYWRAYDWTNYLYACRICNQRYKGAVFPLTPTPPRRWRPSAADTKHRPLLLNCFDDRTPWRHFAIVPSTGAILGRTPKGTATIGTCGLHRTTLRKPRLQAAASAESWCSLILKESAPMAWRALCELGAVDRPFAGAVRAVAEELLDLTWEQIVDYEATLP